MLIYSLSFLKNRFLQFISQNFLFKLFYYLYNALANKVNNKTKYILVKTAL